MLPTALEYPSWDRNGVCVYSPARGGRFCEHFGGYKTINGIPLPLGQALFEENPDLDSHFLNPS